MAQAIGLGGPEAAIEKPGAVPSPPALTPPADG
jgi:hypothetical protein